MEDIKLTKSQLAIVLRQMQKKSLRDDFWQYIFFTIEEIDSEIIERLINEPVMAMHGKKEILSENQSAEFSVRWIIKNNHFDHNRLVNLLNARYRELKILCD